MADEIQVHAITMGDPAGIGPEVIIRSLADVRFPNNVRPLLIGAAPILQRAIELTGVDLRIQQVPAGAASGSLLREFVCGSARDGIVQLLDPCDAAVSETPLSRASAVAGEAAFRCLESAIQLTQEGTADAIVTAPLNKEALHLAGHHYPGHTEILAERCGVSQFGMMLHLAEDTLSTIRGALQPPGGNARPAASGISIVHVTLHTSIASVPGLLTRTAVADSIRLMRRFLDSVGHAAGRIGVCSLNPHGGENGLFGDEEQHVITPAVQECQEMCLADGPFPVDTLIRRAVLGEFTGVVAMYHDQGHIPIKLIGFDSAVNITLGLPLIRTSPTHGTAFDRAWSRGAGADHRGMLEAIRMAAQLVAGKRGG